MKDTSAQVEAIRLSLDEVEELAYRIIAIQRAARAYIISRKPDQLKA